ncbi:MAG: hypothetical protein A3D24_03450 [Candidatus Blackburnbacteria bacterium RIFCSPHIGHO2_02_FULL_39_13]|uniref:Uncharacterized protein n=1 Tax=Candidatus Blackburnbacteria bacterium RIFCSPLOWO2_01_FULL_40_20 TaxID=1797519 RepID=A0A1G1VDY7_9BACT|nr:MAG: hypothetical protein A2694_02210 [Candidatus Blackburnbacteria bacterium RIFCSPHIGHO2_01_FULL_40_17]OGY08148.1 MAG: hypothetical protein A3D24_03450 [Candidatus Blackburnbacteria bacterium RIFCSPHIGHO2_02_FULL_39_13]OGY13432.1 MAG: hypothetical protein A3A77_04660 [Candidatus Blackburnbacteria bacterium RIFCSPLOWO2_01_FULL_40_20]OGY14673.1 MAG: hypothetical protein A3I52_02100 [Candidatus Blackburnbacteria bacterium RIFCSPLOWO2_02_FULL_40_10]HBL52459.1 hypothetical protein [Candidatus B
MEILLSVLLLFLVVPRFYTFQDANKSTQPSTIPQIATESPQLITPQQALDNINSIPDVQNYLKRVPSGIVEIDNEDEKTYTVHVYEIKDNHTATFNWYEVGKQSGKIKTL